MQAITDERGASLSIGALSQQTGVHIETIRYYERVKMLAAPPRTEGGRRVYSQSHRRTLGFIRRARDLASASTKSAPCWIWTGQAAPHAPRCGRLRTITLSTSARSLQTSRGWRRCCPKPLGNARPTLRQYALCSAFSIPRTRLSNRKDCEVSKQATSIPLSRETRKDGVSEKRSNHERGGTFEKSGDKRPAGFSWPL